MVVGAVIVLLSLLEPLSQGLVVVVVVLLLLFMKVETFVVGALIILPSLLEPL